MVLHFEILPRLMLKFSSGLMVTLWITMMTIGLASVVGLVVALINLSRFRVARRGAQLYVDVFRAVPALPLTIWFSYGLPDLVGIDFSPLMAGTVSLSLKYSGYLAETFRAGILAVPRGQIEAARSLGLTVRQTMRRIILPQAMRVVLPAMGNSFVGIVQDSALVSVIGVADLARLSQLEVADTWRPFEVYTAAAIMYLAVTISLAQLNNWIERRLKMTQPKKRRAPLLFRAREVPVSHDV